MHAIRLHCQIQCEDCLVNKLVEFTVYIPDNSSEEMSPWDGQVCDMLNFKLNYNA